MATYHIGSEVYSNTKELFTFLKKQYTLLYGEWSHVNCDQAVINDSTEIKNSNGETIFTFDEFSFVEGNFRDFGYEPVSLKRCKEEYAETLKLKAIADAQLNQERACRQMNNENSKDYDYNTEWNEITCGCGLVIDDVQLDKELKGRFVHSCKCGAKYREFRHAYQIEVLKKTEFKPNVPATHVNLHSGKVGGLQNKDGEDCIVLDYSTDGGETWLNGGIYFEEEHAEAYKKVLLESGARYNRCEQHIRKGWFKVLPNQVTETVDEPVYEAKKEKSRANPEKMYHNGLEIVLVESESGEAGCDGCVGNWEDGNGGCAVDIEYSCGGGVVDGVFTSSSKVFRYVEDHERLKDLSSEEIVERFNKSFFSGDSVYWRSSSVGEYKRYTVKGEAFLDSSETPVVFFEEKSGYCSIEPVFVKYGK